MTSRASIARWGLSVLCLGLLSCTPWQAAYLDKAVNKATEAEVTEQLGSPHAKRALSTGGSEWEYRYQSSPVGPFGGLDTGDGHCRAYVLRFDEKHILRSWTRQAC